MLPARSVLHLSILSKRLRHITTDNELWKALCFRDSFSPYFTDGRRPVGPTPIPERSVFQLQRLLARSNPDNREVEEKELPESKPEVKVTGRACLLRWDPTVTGEQIDWRSDYAARKAPLSIGWLKLPKNKTSFNLMDCEATGLGVIDERRIITTLDDGSICIWHVGDDEGTCGRPVGRSSSGLLLKDARTSDPSQRGSLMTCLPHRNLSAPPIVEGLSVDKHSNKVYVAHGNGLNEIDLTTLQVSCYERYNQAISTISPAIQGQPLTIGTAQAIYIHDPRARRRSGVLATDLEVHLKQESDFYRIYESDPYYAVLAEPLPLSIVHKGSDMIHVGGRFPCIINYDRRCFPNVTSTVYSGARLSCLTTLPSASDNTTLAAAGEYNGKGSVELYPLNANDGSLAGQHIRNRASASRSKCLSIASHGSRIVISDSDGGIKWLERDGTTLVRRWNINQYVNDLENPFSSPEPRAGAFRAEANSGEVARKLLPLSDKPDANLCFWTGERAGIIRIGCRRKMWDGKQVEGDDDDSEVETVSDEERDYGQMMKRAFEKQADEVRFVRGLGLGRSL